jgi:hypothetical protein
LKVKNQTNIENRKETKSILASGTEAAKTLYSPPLWGSNLLAFAGAVRRSNSRET